MTTTTPTKTAPIGQNDGHTEDIPNAPAHAPVCPQQDEEDWETYMLRQQRIEEAR